MSNWTHITGVITVEPTGCCQAGQIYFRYGSDTSAESSRFRRRYGNIYRAKTGV